MYKSSAKIKEAMKISSYLSINSLYRYLLNKQQVKDEQPKISSYEDPEKKKK